MWKTVFTLLIISFLLHYKILYKQRRLIIASHVVVVVIVFASSATVISYNFVILKSAAL